MAKVVYLAVTRARHQREAGLFVKKYRALANEKKLTSLDTSQACVSARIVLTLARFKYYSDTHLSFPLNRPSHSVFLRV